MTAPLTREQQIELMRDSETRIRTRVLGWLRNRAVRRILRKPAPNQETDTKVTQREIKIAHG